MKILLSFPQCHRRGGVERVMFECARYLAARGHEVVIAAEQWEPLPDDAGPGRIEYVRIPETGRYQPPWAAAKTFATRCEKAVRAAGFSNLLHNGHGCVCPPTGVAWVHSVHRAWLERRQQLGLDHTLTQQIKRRINPLHRTLLKLEDRYYSDNRVQQFITLTPQVASDLGRLYGVSDERMVLIPNGFDPEEFCPERRLGRRERSRTELGIASETPVLLFVGHEIARKGLGTAMRAMQQLDRRDAQLLVVGRIPAQSVLQLAQNHGLENRVHACGPTADLGHYHAAADVMVLPTQYEAFCLAILESLGSGLPVVTSAVPGARDAILDGINGGLVDDPLDAGGFADRLEQWLTVARQSEGDLTHAVAESVREYHWSNVLTRYESVIKRCNSVSNPRTVNSGPTRALSPAGRMSATTI